MIKTSPGFSIIELLIASAVGLIIFGSMSLYMTQQVKVMSRMQGKVDFIDLVTRVKDTLLHQQKCVEAFDGQTLNLMGLPSDGLPIEFRLPGGAVLVEGGEFSGLQIERLRITRAVDGGLVAPGERNYFTDIQLGASKNLFHYHPSTVSVLLKLDISTKKVIGCYSGAEVPPGTICGMATNGAGWTGSPRCMGYDPYVSCPPGYDRIHWLVAEGDGHRYICVKQ